MPLDVNICHVCHAKYKYPEDAYCRSCGAKRFTENHCKSCGLPCDLDDLFCGFCGSETELYDITGR